MDKVKLTAAIAAIISFVILGFKLVFGVELLTETEAGEAAAAVAFLIVLGYQIWTKIAERMAVLRAEAEAKRAEDLEQELVEIQIELATTKTRYEKALAAKATPQK